MALDPNWFYSTLSQSTAAIVGLGGGFLVQRVLQQRNEIGGPRGEVRSQLHSGFAALSSRRADAELVKTSLRKALAERKPDPGSFDHFRITEAVHALHPRLGTAGQKGVAHSIPNSAVPTIEEAANVAEALEQAFPDTFEEYLKTLDDGGLAAPSNSAWLDEPRAGGLPFAESTDVMGLLEHQRGLACESWRIAKAKTQEQVDLVAAFKSRIAPSRFYWLLGVMFGMLAVGIVAPLTWLTAREGDSKTFLLIPFAILSVAFFCFIGDELRRLRAAGDLSRETF